MKKLFILLNLLLLPVSYLGFRYYENTPPRKDYSSYAISTDGGGKTILQIMPEDETLSRKEIDEVIEAVPFDPKRCGEPKEPEKKEAPAVQVNPPSLNLKLVGICQMGERSGAIIIDNVNHHAALRLHAARSISYRGGIPRRLTPPPVRPPEKPATSQSCYYRVGDQLPSGCSLKEIREDSVMLAQGASTFELKLEDAPATQVPPSALPEKRIISGKGRVETGRAAAVNGRNDHKNINDKGRGR